MAAGFALSRIAYYLVGVRFDVSPLERFWQYLDPQLLCEDLWRSLYYLHIQPPLFNAYLGLVLKLAGGQAPLVFWASFLCCGLLLHLTLSALLLRLGLSPLAVFLVMVIFAWSPVSILYENSLFYTTSRTPLP